ncbi:MAG TPA: acyltransferase [Caulobacteraceae bacterium]|nr:acyltransferase [Caulobacteraceae bacterium]
MTERSAPPTLVGIQALRGLAAASVVVYHAFQWLDDPFWIGAAGVDVFFVISGYIIWTVGTGAEASPGRFFWRRLTRVAPAYWLMTGLVIAIAAFWPWLMPQISLSPRHIALSLAFIQHHDPRGLPFPVLPPGWSLAFEAVFYGLFTLVLFAPETARFRLIVGALIGVMMFGFLDPPAYELGANPMMLQFAAGVALARRAQLGRRTSVRTGALLAAGGVALLVAMWLTDVRSDLFRPILWGVPATLIVAGVLALEPRFARHAPRAMTALGNASYAIYLCHFVTVDLTARAIGVQQPWLFVPVAVAVSIAAGLAFHKLVERPLIVGARRLPALFAVAGPAPSGDAVSQRAP